MDFCFDSVAASLHNAATEEMQSQPLHRTTTAPTSPPPSNPTTEMAATNAKEDRFKFMSMLDGALCTICDKGAPGLRKCTACGIVFHTKCIEFSGEIVSELCLACQSTQDKKHPQCFMCRHPNSISPLVNTWFHSKPTKVGNVDFCHALCGYANPNCKVPKKGDYNQLICTDMRNYTGTNLKHSQRPCALCGLFEGAKVSCEEKDCGFPGAFYHVSCARQAGLQVDINIKENGEMDYGLRCFTHSDGRFAFRTFLEDLLVIEPPRSHESSSPRDEWVYASRVIHQAVRIMRTLGWAWRWAEWWVQFGDNWKPLLEEGELEDTQEIFDDTAHSRCSDARRCRLAAVGAALRNRDYDTEDGVDEESLKRALQEVLRTKSLAGPLKAKEIYFLVQWLVFAYESKSPALGFGKDRTPVAKDAFCVHQEDESPKYNLGSRELPGKIASQDSSSAPRANEVDDFLKQFTPPINKQVSGKRKSMNDSTSRTSSKIPKQRNMSEPSDSTSHVSTSMLSSSSQIEDHVLPLGADVSNVPAADGGSGVGNVVLPPIVHNANVPAIGSVVQGVTVFPCQQVHDDSNIPAQTSTSAGTTQQTKNTEPVPTAFSTRCEEGKCDEGGDSSAANMNKSNGRALKLSIAYSFHLMETWKKFYISTFKQNGYDTRLVELLDKLFATVDHNDSAVINQAFGLVERYREVYIAKRGPNVYLANVAEFLMKLSWHDSYGSKFAKFVDMLLANVNHDDIALINQIFDLMELHRLNLHLANVAEFLRKLTGHDSYESKLVACLDRVLDVHNDDFRVIKQSFELLEATKDAYVATKGRAEYIKKVSVLVGKLFAGDVEHDDDEIIDQKHCLLKRHYEAYVEDRGLNSESFGTNVVDFVDRTIGFSRNGTLQ